MRAMKNREGLKDESKCGLESSEQAQSSGKHRAGRAGIGRERAEGMGTLIHIINEKQKREWMTGGSKDVSYKH